ncbi:MAG: sigma-70 family RNA polymerase sigma factor [Acidobacteria bacterium]|nr:sigma-70 family RNA polymerase sigma factor [Acidobacteriota bacterium]
MALDKFEKTNTEARAKSVSVEKRSDHQLIEATKKGDETAFAEIVERYRNPLTNYLFRMLDDYEEAVDLVQETFVRVYFAIERYHTEYAFSTYIYRIATNLAISEIRRKRRRRLLSLSSFFQTEENETQEFHPPDEKSLPDENLIDTERSRTIEKAIAALPDKYRAPIVLREIQELSYDEIAQVLGLGLGTTKSRISRARALLREKLKKYFD